MGSTLGRANARHTSTSKQKEAKMSKSMQKQANKQAAPAKFLPRLSTKREKNKKRQEKASKSYTCKLEFMFKMGSSLRRAKHAQANKSKQKCGTHFEFQLQLSSSN